MSLENISTNNKNPNQNLNNLVNIKNSILRPVQSSYALSSWNYGSFHNSNPRYVKTENPVKLIGAEIKNNNMDNNMRLIRPDSAQINKFGKRKLAENEKIVTEEYLKAINDSKNIRGTSRQLNQNRSSSTLRTSKKIQKDYYSNYTQDNCSTNNHDNLNNNNVDNLNYNNYPNNDRYKMNDIKTQQSNDISRNSNNNNIQNRSRISSANKEREKIYRYGMTFNEWNENKNKQIQVTKNLNLLKEHELKEYEKIEQKIDENYQKIKYIIFLDNIKLYYFLYIVLLKFSYINYNLLSYILKGSKMFKNGCKKSNNKKNKTN